MSNVSRKAAVAAAVVVFILLGCEGTNPVAQNQSIVFPDSNVSYHLQVQPMFNLNCTYSGCHDDASTNGLKLTSYANANMDAGLWVPYDPDHSKLVQVLEHKLPHTYALDTLTNHVRGVRQWVKEGAKNN